MAIQTIPGGLWIPNSCPFNASAPGFAGTNIMNDAADFTAFVFQVPKTGTLDLFEVRQQTNANPPDNGLRFSFQDLDASGNPDNTDDQYAVVTSGFGGGAWLVPSGYMGAGGTGSGAKRSVTRGDWLACVIKYESFTASDNVNISTLDYGTRTPQNSALTQYIATSNNSGSTWSKTGSGAISVALKYDDGTYAVLDAPNCAASSTNTRTFNSGSTPDERGLLFQVPFPASLRGVWVRIDSDNAFDIVLYNSASSIVATITVVHTNTSVANGGNGYYPFASSITLTKNSNYRLAIKPGASNISIYDADFNSSDIRIANPGGSTWMSTSRTDAGVWTDANTNLPFMGLVFDGFDDGVSSGGGEHSAVF